MLKVMIKVSVWEDDKEVKKFFKEKSFTVKDAAMAYYRSLATMISELIKL